jgi:hypothetical protein
MRRRKAVFTESHVVEPSERLMPTTRPVCGVPVRTVMRVGRSSWPSGVPSSWMTSSRDVKPGLPIISEALSRRMRSAARFAAAMRNDWS